MNSPNLNAALHLIPSFDGAQVYCPLWLRVELHKQLVEWREGNRPTPPVTPAYVRSGLGQSMYCATPGCDRRMHARCLCSPHYKQYLRGTFSGAPLRTDVRPPRARRSRAGEKQVVKRALVCLMGGKCAICGIADHPDIYDFHHVFEKDDNVSDLLHRRKWWELAVEASKCVLLCANCHRKEHAATR